MKLKRNQPEDEGNPVTGWHVGEEKQPTYDGFRFVDSRRIPREMIDAARDCAVRVRWHRRERAIIAEYLSTVDRDKPPWRWTPKQIRLYDLFVAEEATEAPSMDTVPPSYSVISDVRLEGEAAADALGLDSEWRAMVELPPVRCGPCTRWDCPNCAGEVAVGGGWVPCGCMDCEEGSEPSEDVPGESDPDRALVEAIVAAPTWEEKRRLAGIDFIASYLMAYYEELGLPEPQRLTPDEARALAERIYEDRERL